MRVIYVVASYLLFAALFPLLCLYRKTRQGLKQRLGLYRGRQVVPGGAPRIWLHGASAGDLLALAPMIPLLRQRFPGSRIIASTLTNTGHAMASSRLAAELDAVVYAPYDLWGATRRAVRALRPDVLVLEYAELWPNLIHAAKASGARLVLTNGRISPGQVSRYRALFALTGNALRQLNLLLMRGEEEAERALALGARPESVRVTGNTKFDALASIRAPEPALREALGLRGGDRLWIAGSTHEGEEEALLAIFRRLRERHPELKLLIAPRYADRAARVLALAKGQGLSAALRSHPEPQGASVTVLDTIGELSGAYGLATLVFVGGSFVRRGGQNMLEPAAHGRPVLFGPHTENFQDAVQALVGRGAIQVNDPEQLFRVASELLARPAEMEALGALARSAVEQISGASRRNVELMGALA